MQTDIMSCRLVRDKSIEYQPVSCASDVMGIVKQIDALTSGSEEYVYILCLNTRGDVVGVHEISHGDVQCSIVSPRAVFMRTLLNNSSALILIHNHPSGVCDPSEDDLQLTERIKKAGDILGIKLLDHIIVGDDNFFSFKENELL